MGSGPGITGPDGFNDQTLPLAFHLAVAGTITSEGPYPVSGLPHMLPPVPWKYFTEAGIVSHSQTSHQEVCLPIPRTAPVFRNVMEFIWLIILSILEVSFGTVLHLL